MQSLADGLAPALAGRAWYFTLPSAVFIRAVLAALLVAGCTHLYAQQTAKPLAEDDLAFLQQAYNARNEAGGDGWRQRVREVQRALALAGGDELIEVSGEICEPLAMQ